MGSMNVTPATPLYTGAAVTRTDTGGSTSSIFIVASTAQSILDFRKLVVEFENYSSTAACTITLQKGDNYSEVGQGNAAAITLATAGTAGYVQVVGGTSFESARFQDSDDYCNFVITTAGTIYVSAFLLP
jgi:hypothetical protein